MQQYVEVSIPQKFIDSMKSFQRVLQISLEGTMREIYTSTVDDFKAQLRFAIEQIELSTGKSMLPPKAQSANETAESATGIGRDDLVKMSRDAVMQTRIVAAECFQLDITLKYSKDKMVLDPPTQQWVTEQTS